MQCFAGAGDKMMKDIAGIMGVPVAGQIRLNGLSPILEPVQNFFFSDGSGKKVVGAGKRTLYPNGDVK